MTTVLAVIINKLWSSRVITIRVAIHIVQSHDALSTRDHGIQQLYIDTGGRIVR